MLPVRDGVGPSQVALPVGHWSCMLDFLVERFPGVTSLEWRARMECGDVVDAAGERVAPERPYKAHGKLYYYRTVAQEVCNAQPISVLYEDEFLVVADKPHFLPVTPAGQHLQDTLLVRLRRQLGEDTLTPLHRLDRETAGVIVFARRPGLCRPYHVLFEQRQMRKVYEAIAPVSALTFPLARSSRIVPCGHFMQMREMEGDGLVQPNAHTDIALLEVQGAFARYRLRPLTGKKHQLRVHMAALGLPILGDRIYPALQAQGPDDHGNPLRLLAQSISFDDPFTGAARSFVSRMELTFPQADAPV